MARSRPTLRQLEYLLAVSQTLNFRAAAARCHVSQPALSEQIRGLEQLLGVQLLERDKRRVALTAAGELVVERARAALSDVDSLVEAALGHGGPLTGPLSLGAIPTVAPYVLPGLLAAARRAWPKLRFILRESHTATLVEELRAGRLDCALLALPVNVTGLQAVPLFEDPFLLAAPRDHRLAGRAPARLSELRREEVMLLDDGHCLREQALELCGEAGAHEAGDVRATSLRTLTRLVAEGLGITLLPALARDEVPPDAPVSLRSFRAPAPSRTIGLVWRSTSTRAAEFLLLAETARGALPDGVTPRS
jgi:LysR family hydrogen peroxide-inducible transcriptional activator